MEKLRGIPNGALRPPALRASVLPWILGKEKLKYLLVFKFVGLMRLFLCFEYLKKLIFFHNIFKKQKKKTKQNRKIKKGWRAKEKVTSMTAPLPLHQHPFATLAGPILIHPSVPPTTTSTPQILERHWIGLVLPVRDLFFQLLNLVFQIKGPVLPKRDLNKTRVTVLQWCHSSPITYLTSTCSLCCFLSIGFLSLYILMFSLFLFIPVLFLIK